MTWPPPPPPPYPPPYPPPGPGRDPFGLAGTNRLAIAALAVSVASFFLFWPAGIVGAILGQQARKQIKQTREDGDGLATAGIWIGWVLFVLGVLSACLVAALWVLGVGFRIWLWNNT